MLPCFLLAICCRQTSLQNQGILEIIHTIQQHGGGAGREEGERWGGGRTDEFCRFVLSLVDEVFEALFHAVDKLLVRTETFANHSVYTLLEVCFKNKNKKYSRQQTLIKYIFDAISRIYRK